MGADQNTQSLLIYLVIPPFQFFLYKQYRRDICYYLLLPPTTVESVRQHWSLNVPAVCPCVTLPNTVRKLNCMELSLRILGEKGGNLRREGTSEGREGNSEGREEIAKGRNGTSEGRDGTSEGR